VNVAHARQTTTVLKGLRATKIAARIDGEFGIEGEAHGQGSTVRDSYQLGVPFSDQCQNYLLDTGYSYVIIGP
jgi:hypothetical protein